MEVIQRLLLMNSIFLLFWATQQCLKHPYFSFFMCVPTIKLVDNNAKRGQYLHHCSNTYDVEIFKQYHILINQLPRLLVFTYFLGDELYFKIELVFLYVENNRKMDLFNCLKHKGVGNIQRNKKSLALNKTLAARPRGG